MSVFETERQTTRRQLTRFISQHIAWKMLLDHAVHSTGADFRAMEVQRHDVCEFGVWLRAVEVAAHDEERFQEVCKRHVDFHKKAEEVIALIQRGETRAAQRALEPRGGLFQASADLTQAVMDWKKALPE